eukprot:6112619-Prorocentrum_lima.AAC.1
MQRERDRKSVYYSLRGNSSAIARYSDLDIIACTGSQSSRPDTQIWMLLLAREARAPDQMLKS